MIVPSQVLRRSRHHPETCILWCAMAFANLSICEKKNANMDGSGLIVSLDRNRVGIQRDAYIECRLVYHIRVRQRAIDSWQFNEELFQES